MGELGSQLRRIGSKLRRIGSKRSRISRHLGYAKRPQDDYKTDWELVSKLRPIVSKGQSEHQHGRWSYMCQLLRTLQRSAQF